MTATDDVTDDLVPGGETEDTGDLIKVNDELLLADPSLVGVGFSEGLSESLSAGNAEGLFVALSAGNAEGNAAGLVGVELLVGCFVSLSEGSAVGLMVVLSVGWIVGNVVALWTGSSSAGFTSGASTGRPILSTT